MIDVVISMVTVGIFSFFIGRRYESQRERHMWACRGTAECGGRCKLLGPHILSHHCLDEDCESCESIRTRAIETLRGPYK